MFCITKLEIDKECRWTKILEPGEYRFVNEEFDLNQKLYGKNITISAIVGMNGSGKSSIVEMIFRVLNNFCAMFCESKKLNNNPFRFIYEVCATVHFRTYRSSGFISSRDNYVLVHLDGVPSFNLGFGDGPFPKGYKTVWDVNDDTEENLISGLFYCIAANYAPFAFNSNDFALENCVAVRNMRPSSVDVNRHNWLDAAFHKNDGYFSNFTLVPFRNSGNFNAQKELDLSRLRILEILVSYPDFIDGYFFEDAAISMDSDPLHNKFSFTTPSYDNNYTPKYDTNALILDFEEIIRNYITRDKKSVASTILEELCPDEIQDINHLSYSRVLALLYIVYKVLSCAKYPSMGFPNSRFKTDMTFEYGTAEDLEDVAVLARNVKADNSHITIKIVQTINFLQICDFYELSNIRPKSIRLSRYWKLLEFDKDKADVFEIARHLPPPFLVPEVILKHGKEHVSISMMSAGERQFYNTMSSVAYHLMNLISVNNSLNRTAYRNALVILDEVELCYHPEYQRSFVDSLVGMIERLGFNCYISIHFLLTTHSPFILSDIPKNNILYLHQGRPLNADELINPFAANINDILAQSFFLDKGFIGERARRVISDAVDSLMRKQRETGKSECEEWSDEQLDNLIGMIGEPLIRNRLSQLRGDKRSRLIFLKKERERISKEIREIEEE